MDGSSECKKMSVKCLIPFIAVFITLYGYQWLFHVGYMMPYYEATASVWRPAAEMKELLWVGILTNLILAFAITCLYCWVAKSCDSQGRCLKKGAKFGFKIGLIFGAHDFASYAWLPVEMNIPLNWFVGDVIMGVLVGIVLAYCCRMCKKPA